MRIGLLIFPGVEELDVVGPWSVFANWNRYCATEVTLRLVAQSLEPVPCSKGLAIAPQVTYDSMLEVDCLVIPGGLGTRTEVDNPVTLEFIATAAAAPRAVLTVCTGVFLLQAAGGLNGSRTTTHWRSLDRLRATGAMVVEERVVRDGRHWSAAGVSAGIDAALAMVAALDSPAVAGAIQRDLEYFPTELSYSEAPTVAYPRSHR